MILLQVYNCCICINGCCICINGILKPDFLGLADSFCSYDDFEENKFQVNCGQGKRHYYYSNFKKLFYSCCGFFLVCKVLWSSGLRMCHLKCSLLPSQVISVNMEHPTSKEF